jgi:uncharacterized protein HemX
MDQTTPVSAPTTPPSTNGLGEKVAIVIILLVLIIGSVIYFTNRPKQEVQQTPLQTNSENEQQVLTTELDSASSINLDTELELIDKELQ